MNPETLADLEEIKAREERLRTSTPKKHGRWDRIVHNKPITANPYEVGSVKWGFYREAWLKADKEMARTI